MANPENLAVHGGPDLFEIQDAQRRVFPYESWDNTLAFLSELTFAGPPSQRKHYVPPLKIKTDRGLRDYNRRLELAGKIFGGEYSNPLSDVARDEKVSREWPRQVAERVLDALHESSSPELKEKYPRNLLSTDKRTSIRHGIAGQILAGIEEGLNIKELNRRFGGNVSYARERLKEAGIDIPNAERVIESFAGLKNPEATDQEIQALLDKVQNKRRYQELRKAGLIINLLSLARQTGYHIGGPEVHFIYQSLEGQIPLGKMPSVINKDGNKYVAQRQFTATLLAGRAARILNRDHNLDDLKINPVKQIAGPLLGKTPNTSQFRSENYRSVANLITKITGKIWSGRGRVSTMDMISGSPAAVYFSKSTHGYRYEKDHEEELSKHLESQVRKFGLI